MVAEPLPMSAPDGPAAGGGGGRRNGQASAGDARPVDRRVGGAARRIHLLLVEPDPLLREMLAAALPLQDRRFRVHTADTPEAAFVALLGDEVDLIISEVVFPQGADSAFITRLRRMASHLPLLVLTEAPTAAARLVPDLDAILAKPPDIDFLTHRIAQLLDLQRTSVVRGFSLESFLQVLELERKTCTLDVDARGQAGRVWLLDGRLVEARAERATGKEALFAMLAWGDVVMRLADGCAIEPRIDESLRALLLEHCVRRDHGEEP